MGPKELINFPFDWILLTDHQSERRGVQAVFQESAAKLESGSDGAAGIVPATATSTPLALQMARHLYQVTHFVSV